MDNDYIVDYMCQKYNIDLSKYQPTNEHGVITDNDFDKRYSLDRIYLFEFGNFKQRVRFVKYNDQSITLFKITVKISNIIHNELEKNGKKVYIRDIHTTTPLLIINRLLKLKIMNYTQTIKL